jgi:tetratricopeptide (TPR) repeat protein
MPGLNPLSFIPVELQQQMFNALIDFLSDQAQKVLGDEVSVLLKGLRSDAAFAKQFEAGLKRAAERFLKEYEAHDEDLTAAIAGEPDFFKNEQVQAALLWMLKHPGTDLEQQRDVLAQSFETVLPARKNRVRVESAVMYFLKCLTEEVWTLPELQPIYSLQFQRMTAEATRQQVELQKAQLQAQVELNSGLREALLQLTDALTERKLLTAGSTSPQVLHNLPQPDHGRFVGREDEVKRITRILRPYPHSQHSIVTIDGIGGIGKSALALEVAHRYLRNYAQIPPEERFDAITWTSAKQNVLTAEGIVPRQQALRTLDDIYTAIAITLQREGITRVRPEEQMETVRNALTRQRTLLIVDNLETVDDKAVMEFLRELPAPTKAMVTTRYRLDVAYPVRLTGMPWDDAQLLIADECAKKNVNLNEDSKRRLYERTGGVPLAMTWSIAQMGFGHSAETVLKRLGQPNNDVARFCFEGAIKRISGQPAHQLLMALSVFTTDASREALRVVSELPPLDADDGFVVLEKLSLVNKDGNRFQALPLTLTCAMSEVQKYPELERAYRERWIRYYVAFLNEQRTSQTHSVPTIDPEIANIVSVVEWCAHYEHYSDLIAAVRGVDSYLWRTAKWGTMYEFYELGLKASILIGDVLNQAGFLRLMSNVRDFQGDFDEAQRLADRSLELYRQIDDKVGIALCLFRLASIEQTRQNLENARQIATEGLHIANDACDVRYLARMYCRLGSVELDSGNYSEAEKNLREALAIIESLPLSERDSWVLAWANQLLGRVHFAQGEYQQAGEYYRKILEIGERISSIQDIADAKRYMSELELVLGQIDHAEKDANDALALFDKLGMKKRYRAMQDLLDRIAAAKQ